MSHQSLLRLGFAALAAAVVLPAHATYLEASISIPSVGPSLLETSEGSPPRVSASNGYEFAYADLRTGALGVRVYGLSSNNDAAALLQEEILFSSSQTTDNGVLLVPFTVSYEGTLYERTHYVAFSAVVGSVYGSVQVNDFLRGDGGRMLDLYPGSSGSTIAEVEPGVFAGTFAILSSGSTVVSVTLSLGLGGDGDFSHTARLRFDTLPQDVSWTSSSDYFLAAVPEPEQALLFAVGIAVLAARQQRKSRRLKGGT